MAGRVAAEEMKYQGGEDYADPVKVQTGILTDIKALHAKGRLLSTVQTLYEVTKTKGQPIDDKKMTMEKLIGITASLPSTSKTRLKLTDTVIDTLWDSLQHPPLSYMGDEFQYRTADGSNNNVLNPNLGKAGTAYAKTCKSEKKQHAVRPDPGMLFDMLMARPEGEFKKNPAGVSSMLFYHATIIIHDIFRTNRVDPNISDASSYLDLAPLYGSNRAEQEKVRTMELGKLWPDTFHERRLLAQPPGVNVMLVMYNRFHNYVADILFKINEGNRFPEPDANVLLPDELTAARKKLDEDLFQTARLITGGMYCNISLHDYLRGLTNCHHSDTDWAFDPRIAIDQHFDGHGTPRGVGNQVSAEFNLLYRFHSIISQRDEKWLEDFLSREVFKDISKPLEKLNPKELLMGLLSFEKNIPDDPKIRTFAGLRRDPKTGRFDDGAMVQILKDAIEEPAGLFGARMVPKALRVVEILGILQSRKWGLASLNEFRDFFGLARHKTMEDINPNPEIADILRALYDHPDMVELYPGLFLEEGKPELQPGCGGCPPFTVGRAVFSDAVTLVRSDRFYTIDYTAATLTNWGITEVAPDYRVLAGSMYYKLIQRALPGWFPYNSLHVMQPFYTKEKNAEIAKEIGTYKYYTEADPKKPPTPKIVMGHDAVKKVLVDQRSFMVPWAPALNAMFPGERDFTGFMLGGDQPANTAQRNLVGDIIYSPQQFKQLLSNTVVDLAKTCLTSEEFVIGGPGRQIDILRDVVIPVNARVLGDLFSLDLKTTENPYGSLSLPTLYKHLLNVRIWGFNNNDPGMAWRRRMWATEGADALTKSTNEVLKGVKKELQCETMYGWLTSSWTTPRPSKAKSGSLRWYGRQIVKEMLKAGKTVEEAGDICWLTALAGVGAPVTVFTETLKWFLDPENQSYWAEIQGFAAENSPKADAKIRDYVLEAQRLTSSQRNLRICKQAVTINGQAFMPGDVVVCLLGPACKDQTCIPNPTSFQPGRDRDAYMHFGFGPHECFGREIALTFVTSLIKVVAGLKNLRRAPGPMGLCKYITVNQERCYLNDNWSWLTFDPTTWKLHFDGEGKGVYDSTSVRYDPDWDLDAIKRDITRMYKAKTASASTTNGAPKA
ncbi:prostaglandin G/H synthase 2/cyclooxygenase 2, pgh2/cox2 [Lindgomyces ingoldianus]|uniref:Prostaglandin G/H synthase 2/cyclooxygenase 2, pgh2/cox2 n=1 Tax=Lindgomyces ingoldianus TaxID=673940 RepID=A0ACB6RIK0_9PLEO|nr:prostaglandin G/H synthase 2/cyclooxygenase 2, pgh2/cox2 [Lindgomyces ingoldianus]KAF2478296.1 prostaglandin G/H synthase 2/cyclooxygenase 2, pgh2/cox2 [Lindgomyces ingoldianus]